MKKKRKYNTTMTKEQLKDRASKAGLVGGKGLWKKIRSGELSTF